MWLDMMKSPSPVIFANSIRCGTFFRLFDVWTTRKDLGLGKYKTVSSSRIILKITFVRCFHECICTQVDHCSSQYYMHSSWPLLQSILWLPSANCVDSIRIKCFYVWYWAYVMNCLRFFQFIVGRLSGQSIQPNLFASPSSLCLGLSAVT